MSHPVIEIASGAVVLLAVAFAAFLAVPNPRPKPEPPIEKPPVEVVTEATETRPATLRARPLPQKTDAERVEELEDEAEKMAAEQRALKERLDKAIGLEQGNERVR